MCFLNKTFCKENFQTLYSRNFFSVFYSKIFFPSLRPHPTTTCHLLHAFKRETEKWGSQPGEWEETAARTSWKVRCQRKANKTGSGWEEWQEGRKHNNKSTQTRGLSVRHWLAPGGLGHGERAEP